LWWAPQAGALTGRPFVDVTPAGSGLILCPAALGGGSALAWVRLREPLTGDVVGDLVTAGLDPQSAPAPVADVDVCPVAASAPSGASLIVYPADRGRLWVVERGAGGAIGTPLKLSDRRRVISHALAGTGAAIVAWEEDLATASTDPNFAVVRVAVRDPGGPFGPAVEPGAPSRTGITGVAAGVDDIGFGVVAWANDIPRSNDATLMFATRAPGGPFTAPRALGTLNHGDMKLAVAPTGEALLAVAGEAGAWVASGSARSGLGPLRRLASRPAHDVRVAFGASGGAAVAWTQASAGTNRATVRVSDRRAGGEFAAPHALVDRRSPLGADAVDNLRLAAAADGRLLASWTVDVRAGDRLVGDVPVAALRKADGTWEPVVALTAGCRSVTDAFPGFDASGRPRVTLVDSALLDAGDMAYPSDSRVRVVALDGAAPALGPPPKVTLAAARRQILRPKGVKLKISCARACDALVFGVIRGYSGPRSGLFPAFRRLRAGGSANVALTRTTYFDRVGALEAGRSVSVRLVLHACDDAGRLARARRTIRVRVPHAPDNP